MLGKTSFLLQDYRSHDLPIDPNLSMHKLCYVYSLGPSDKGKTAFKIYFGDLPIKKNISTLMIYYLFQH